MTYQPYTDRKSFLEYFKRTTRELALYAKFVLQTVQKDAYWEEEKRDVIDLWNFLPFLGFVIAEADGRITDDEVDFLDDTFGPVLSVWSVGALKQQPAVDYLRNEISSGNQKYLMDILHKALKVFDEFSGSNFVKVSHDLIFAFTKEVALADGAICKEESQALVTVRQMLYQGKDIPFNLIVRSDKAKHQLAPIQGRFVEAVVPQIIPSVAPGHGTNPKLIKSLKKLNELIGLDIIKKDVNEIANFARLQKLREAKGLPTLPIARHLVFYGNPGTGKTTVARLLAEIYSEMGILSKGHIVEADRSTLVAGYVGQTALKVNEVVENALGGILFIDEAYSLSSKWNDNFGEEAINVLLKLMEDHRDDLVVIVAGYTDKMDDFLMSNPGLRSRFTTMLRFNDYEPHELVMIFESLCANNHYRINPSAKAKLNQVFTELHRTRDESFGNARLARTLFEMSTVRQANRVLASSHISDDDLVTMSSVDVPGLGEIPGLSLLRTKEYPS